MKNNKKKPFITVLIPAVNEEKIIKKLIIDCLKNKVYKIDPLVIIDSKTSDDTGKIANKSGARVIHIGKSLGKGHAIIRAIPHIKGEYVLQIDSDYQFQPYEIPKLIEPLRNGFNVTLGSRYQKGANVEKGSVSTIKLLGSYILSFATSIFAKQKVTDVMAGFKAFKTTDLKKIVPSTKHFGYEAELVIKSAQKNLKILNVPITYKKRNVGKSSVNSIKHGILVLITIIKTGLKF